MLTGGVSDRKNHTPADCASLTLKEGGKPCPRIYEGRGESTSPFYFLIDYSAYTVKILINIKITEP